MTGQKFHRLTVVDTSKGAQWDLVCDCGTKLTRSRWVVTSGNTKSCGCLKRDTATARNKATAKHASMSHTPTGSSWSAMMARCFNANYHCYAQYGAVGITVCEFIRATPVNLLLLIGSRPDGKTIDRIDTLKNYSCGNCKQCFENGWTFNVRWATPLEQGRNQRTNRMVEFNGKAQCVMAWAEELGVPESRIRNRLDAGWPVGDALHKPAKVYRKKL